MNMIPEDDLPPALAARMAQLRTAAAQLAPPPALEAALHSQLFRRASAADVATQAAPARATGAIRTQDSSPKPVRPVRHAPSLLERWAAWLAWPVSVAAATGLCSWMVFTHPAVAPERLDTYASDVAAGRQPVENATPFLALAAMDDIPVSSRNEIVTASVPRSTLAEFGLPVSPLRAADNIAAEFLVGPNGKVLAVRFVDEPGR